VAELLQLSLLPGQASLKDAAHLIWSVRGGLDAQSTVSQEVKMFSTAHGLWSRLDASGASFDRDLKLRLGNVEFALFGLSGL
jgi:hypothetical protein